MHGLSGYEGLVDPPVRRRPLPFSRAWLAAFVLAVIAIGWVAVVDRLDAQALVAEVAALERVVETLESVTAAEQSHLVSRQLLELEAIVDTPRTRGDARVERAWQRVAGVSRQSRGLDPSDPQQVRLIVADLRLAHEELDELTIRYQGH
jgi:hypothetical protein